MRKFGPVFRVMLLGWSAAVGLGKFFDHFGDVIIPRCSSGIQQGDPLGPMGFSIALQPLVESVKDEVPNLNISVYYLDDSTLCGNPADLAVALEIIEKEV